ncbi:hypothetical protein M4D50_01105 [Rothia sp. p3-SID1597]|nr:hypothetical protein [Rothia sp. p3-SID1597]
MSNPAYLHIHATRTHDGRYRWGFTCRLCGGGIHIATIPNAWQHVLTMGRQHLYTAHTPRHLETYGEAHTYLT